MTPGGVVRVTGRGFHRGLRASFPLARAGRRRTVAAKVLGTTRLSAPVPAGARSGRVWLLDTAGRRTRSVGPVRIAVPAPPGAAIANPAPTGTAFDGAGMWIWQLSRTAGGDPQAILAQARAHGITTLFVKSADGTTPDPQFTPALIAAFKAGGMKVCAWQYVYGAKPEARPSSPRGRARRRRLLRDRRRDRVRGPLRPGPALHDRAARAGRPRLPGRPRRVPLRRLPPGVPLLGLPRPRRRRSSTCRRSTGRRSAAG